MGTDVPEPMCRLQVQVTGGLMLASLVAACHAVRMRLWIMVVGAALAAGPAVARIGENQIQHEQRYGRAREDARTNNTATLQLNCKKTYDYQGWQLVVTFESGRAECVEYWKAASTDQDVDAILRAEAGGGQWTESVPARSASRSGRMVIPDAAVDGGTRTNAVALPSTNTIRRIAVNHTRIINESLNPIFSYRSGQWTNTNGRIATRYSRRVCVMSSAYAARKAAEDAARRAPKPPPAF